jgi:hypothetical protein
MPSRYAIHLDRLKAIDAGQRLPALTKADVDYCVFPNFDVVSNSYSKPCDTLLSRAASKGNDLLVKEFLALGATVDMFSNKRTALMRACRGGHVDVIKTLLSAGADPNLSCISTKVPDEDAIWTWPHRCASSTPIQMAVLSKNEEAVLCLLEAGATCSLPLVVISVVEEGMSDALMKMADLYCKVDPLFERNSTRMSIVFGDALCAACKRGHVQCFLILQACVGWCPYDNSGYGSFPAYLKKLATNHGQEGIVAELDKMAPYTSPLHFIDRMPACRARALLRSGFHFADDKGGVTPLELAQRCRNSPAAEIICLAAGPWSREMHALLPLSERERVLVLLVIGYQFARKFGQEAGSFVDAWIEGVLPHAGCRSAYTSNPDPNPRAV